MSGVVMQTWKRLRECVLWGGRSRQDMKQSLARFTAAFEQMEVQPCTKAGNA